MKAPTANRRDFIKTTATAALGVALGLKARAASASAGAAKPVRWGVIGAGNRALNAHFRAIAAEPDTMEILGVCDVTEANLDRGVKLAGGAARAYRDYQQLLANPDINAVLVSTPGYLHREMLVAALSAGKHVLCEKPMGISPDDGQAMQKAADASDRVVLYGTQLRYSPFYREIRRQIEAGRIGAPKHLFLRLHRGDWNPNGWVYTDPRTGRRSNWRFVHAASGGLLAEEGCHYLDIMNMMVGAPPKSLRCHGGISCYTSDGRDTWDHATATLAYDNGCLGSFDVCQYAPHHLELQVLGSEGALQALPAQQSLAFVPRRRGAAVEKLGVPEEVGHGMRGPRRGVETAVARMYEDFLACVREDQRPVVDSRQALAACRTAWLGDLSHAAGRDVAWTELG